MQDGKIIPLALTHRGRVGCFLGESGQATVYLETQAPDVLHHLREFSDENWVKESEGDLYSVALSNREEAIGAIQTCFNELGVMDTETSSMIFPTWGEYKNLLYSAVFDYIVELTPGALLGVILSLEGKKKTTSWLKGRILGKVGKQQKR